MKGKILFVEDDLNLGFVTKDNLEVEGFEVVHCDNGKQAIETFKKEKFDLCLLDVMLPEKDGFTLADEIRSLNIQIPIIFLTAKSLVEDKIKGLRLGADDYITKPFSMDEVILKIEVFLKRSQVRGASKEAVVFEIGNYTFDFNNLMLSHPKEEKKLTKKEASLLRFLAERMENVSPREEILLEIWGKDDYFLGRSLDVFISRLRKYLRHDWRLYIQNIHSVGFKLGLDEEN